MLTFRLKYCIINLLGGEKMKRIFDYHAFDIMQADNGIVVIEKIDDDDKKVIRYKYISVIGVKNVRPITKSTFLDAKYRDNYPLYADYIDNYLLAIPCWLDTSLLVISPINGSSSLVDKKGNLIWSGVIKYNSEYPSDAVVYNDNIWATFPNNNVIVRFNTKTMKEELRIGGNDRNVFNAPHSLWITDENHMLVCNGNSNNIIDIDLKTFSVKEYLKFNDRIKKYVRVGSLEFVLSETGLYEI